MKCTGYVMKNHNEMCSVYNEKLQWNAQVSNEKSQWNTHRYIWKTAMKCTGYLMKNRNEIPRDKFEKSQWNALGM